MPMSRAEMEKLGWKELDVLIITGDCYVDHPSYGVLDEQLGVARAALLEVLGVVAAHKPGEAHESLGFFFLARHADFVGVDDDDEIARVNVGGENGFFFAAHQAGRLHGNAAKDLILGVDDPPVALHFVGFG